MSYAFSLFFIIFTFKLTVKRLYFRKHQLPYIKRSLLYKKKKKKKKYNTHNHVGVDQHQSCSMLSVHSMGVH